jgi:hypothetical protein
MENKKGKLFEKFRFKNLNKLLPVLLVVVLLALPFSDYQAFAYNGGFLQTLSGTYSNLSFGTSAGTKINITDNNMSTYDSVDSVDHGSYTNLNNNVWWNLPYSSDLTSFYIATNSTYTAIHFKHADGTITTSYVGTSATGNTSSAYASGTTVSVSESNVVAVDMENLNTAVGSYYEFDVYGTQNTPVSHDEITGLAVAQSGTNANISYNIPSSNTHYTGSKIYRDGTLIATQNNTATSFVDTVAYSTTYQYKVTAIYDDGFETAGSTYTLTTGSQPTDPNSIPPNPVSGLVVSNITDHSLHLSWSASSSSTVTGYNVYENGSLIQSINDPTLTSFDVSGLSGSTQYSFDVTAFTSMNVESLKSTVSITTLATPDTVAPDVPTNVQVSAGDASAYVTWDKSTASDLAGYNVYVDGAKVNTTLINGTSFTIDGLTNGNTVNVAVSAVDKSGNESILSSSVSVTPKMSLIPVIHTNYDLADVVTGIQNWFASYWLIIAFASAIPLSFYIASRIKLMFLD